ncbi:MAG: DNA repair protein RecO [Candidatus Dojkabacteria bacterium]|jgi:DNA repair protein RecO (recombination protein O)|nr:DNA repair protein RecO [Candidatus Dojkabacteria bacterium]
MSRDIVTVIKSVNYAEADKILTVYGKYNGKFALIAKGIRKIVSKNRGNMQTLSTSEISFYEGRGLPILTESQLIYSPEIDSHMDIQNTQRVLYLLNKFLVEGERNQKVFDLLQSVLQNSMDTVRVNKFRIQILKNLGFLGDFNICDVCKKKKEPGFILPKNFTVVCKDCYSKSDKGVKLGKNIYANSVFTEALDKYIKKIVEEI